MRISVGISGGVWVTSVGSGLVVGASGGTRVEVETGAGSSVAETSAPVPMVNDQRVLYTLQLPALS